MALGVLFFVASAARLAEGILSIQDPSVPVEPARAQEYAEAVAAAADTYHLDPWELVAVARNESRFRADEVGPDGKDCGIMQTRVTGSRYSCWKLRRDYKLAFLEGARELASYRATCRQHADFDRCRFNRYNSGVHYLRQGFHGHYWLRVMCFVAAAQAGEPGGGCLEVQSRRSIAQAMRRPVRGGHRGSRLFAASEARARRMH